MIKLGILGTGNMAEAIVAGLGRSSKKVAVTGFDVDRARLKKLAKKYRFRAATNLSEVLQKSDILLLSVKPQQMKELLTEIAPLLSSKHLLLSIAAGLDLRFFEKILGDAKIVRLMPNTPALVGLGATAFFPNSHCSAKDKRTVNFIFESVGQVVSVPSEGLLDAVTALSGSGPAFVYLFIKALIDGGTKLGLDPSLSRSLAIQTLLGATTLLKQSPDAPAALISRVASKGGTTEAGLKVLAQKKFETIVGQCLEAAHKQAGALRKQLHLEA